MLDIARFSKLPDSACSLLNMLVFRDRLREAMTRVGMTQAELARRVGVSGAGSYTPASDHVAPEKGVRCAPKVKFA